MAKLTKESLANAVGDLLSLPRYGRRGESYRIVKVILKTMTLSLLRGESIKIDGFGILKIYETPATRRIHRYLLELNLDKRYAELVDIPPQKRVIFKPSKALKRYINL